MRPLSEVFAPGAPTLPERLRTLVVSPERELEPGMTVRATFTFRNHGGASATGVRLRFNVPEGLVYLVGSGRLDGNDLDDELGNSPLLARAGAQIGDVAPGEERQIEIAYSVAGAIENGTVVELQAALASFELPPVGSNVVRLAVRSKPQLRNALTRIAIDAHHEPVPGSEAQVTVRMHNAGQSSAHDVVVVAPVPEHASYVAGSARVNGREVERDLGSSFDRAYAPILLRSLAANASATLVYRVRIDSPLPDGSQVVARAQIASQETAAFALEPASLTVVASPSFSDDRTAFVAQPAHDVHPGQRVTLTLTTFNTGNADAHRVSAAIELPEGLVLVRGAATIDGRTAPHRRKDPLRFAFGRIDAGGAVTLRAEAIVASPLPDATVLACAAALEWEPSRDEASRRLECSVTVRSEPAFSPRRNVLEQRGSEVVHPGDALEAAIVLTNEGSAAAHDVVLHLRIDPLLDELGVFEGNARLNLERSSSATMQADTVDLGSLEPHDPRRLIVRARVPSPSADRAEIRVGASLHTRELGETPLREAFWRVDSHAAFNAETSRLELADDSLVRPNQLAQIDVTVANVGTDVAHNACLRLYISPEARLESVEGAGRERSSLLLGEIAPGARARARIALRLLRSMAKEFPVTVDGVLTADSVLPVPLARLTISTAAEPDFSVGSFHAEPADTVDAGESVDWVLQIRNGGDGVAHRVEVYLVASDSLIYVPNSTTVNDVPVRDVGALPPFAVDRGIVLNEVDPGVEAAIKWRTVVHNGLTAGTSVQLAAQVRYDGDRVDEIAAPPLNVRASPVFANAIPGLPFGLDGMLGPGLGGEPRAVAADRFMELPPATPVVEGNGSPARAALVAGIVQNEGGSFESAGTMVAFTAERLARTLRLLREVRFGNLVTHLFGLRAFLPDAIGDTYSGALSPLREHLREELDRLFIKLRLPRYEIASRDIETPSLRATIERVVHEAALARGVPTESPTASIALRGLFLPAKLSEIGERLSTAQLARALPWAALARLLPDDSAVYSEYRGCLVETFDGLRECESADFLDALQHRQEDVLDRALDAICASLHAAA
jgi:uncharacterized repeat protein (TIGR01451 family)